MKNEIEILHEVISKFDTLNISCMLTGSMALAYYATPRMTRDIDLVIELNINQVSELLDAFKEDYYISKEAIEDSIKNEFLFNIINIENAVKIDCIIKKNNEYRKNEFRRKRKVKFNNFEIFIVSKEDLIISKLYWAKDSNSEQQIKDIKNLVASGMDKNYINQWTEKLSLNKFWKEILGE